MAGIVVIDSEPTVRTVVSKILQRGGHSVRATGDFDQALEMLHQEIADLVVTNVFLRGITGHDAMQRLHDEFPGLRILMVSGLPDAEVIEQWMGNTGFDIFPKPFTSDSLLGKVLQVLSSSP